MANLPDEIWTDVLDYLDPTDLISTQRTSCRLLKLARDSKLWRNKCFEKAPSAAYSQASNPNALSALTGALSGLSLGTPSTSSQADRDSRQAQRTRLSGRARAVVEWDCSDPSETIDWYSEYVARHAPLYTAWAEESTRPDQEVRGMAIFSNAGKVIGPLENGSLCIWDIQTSGTGRRSLKERAKSQQGILFQDLASAGESSKVNGKSRSLGTAVDNISIDGNRMRAYVSTQDVLNEVDLERMEVVSQTRYSWPITALSQETGNEYSLTVGTSWSLHVHDPRISLNTVSSQSDTSATVDAKTGDEHIAFLPNYTKQSSMRSPTDIPSPPHSFRDIHSWVGRGSLAAYGHVEPGPQSILHHGANEIIISGRMPSILFYDRRSFPRLQSVIHSGARLSSMTTLPVPPAKAGPESRNSSTLIACGEYNGVGSLEIYELSPNSQSSLLSQSDNPNENTFTTNTNSSQESIPSPAPSPSPHSKQNQHELYRFRDRKQASSAKLLSVITQGTRIIYSDAEGGLKWVERNGTGLARRWNINTFHVSHRGGSVSGEQVVRKMIGLPALSLSPYSLSSHLATQSHHHEEHESERGTKGDTDILVWTGDKLGIVTFKPPPTDQHHHDSDDLISAFERGMDLNGESSDDTEEMEGKRKEREYASIMRRALERQADERRWMSRFGVKRW